MPDRGLVDVVVSRLPDPLAARIDLLRPSVAKGFTGPLNGQEHRVAAVTAMFERIPFDLVVETGTHRGTSTVFFRTLTAAPIITIEASGRFAAYAYRRLRSQADTRVIHGDSSVWIRRLAKGKHPVDTKTPFFYLDAHGGGSLPLRFEMLEVASCWSDFCAIVDDFQVPDDPGYEFGAYGPGFALTTDVLVGLDLAGAHAFWPSAKAADDTGHRRGMLVLARGAAIVEGLRGIGELREDTELIGRLRAQAPYQP